MDITTARNKALAVLVEIAEDKGVSKEVRAQAATEILRTYDPTIALTAMGTAAASSANTNSA